MLQPTSLVMAGAGSTPPNMSMLINTTRNRVCACFAPIPPRNFLLAACSDPKGIDDACKRLVKEKSCTYHRCASDNGVPGTGAGAVLESSQAYGWRYIRTRGGRIVDHGAEKVHRGTAVSTVVLTSVVFSKASGAFHFKSSWLYLTFS